MSSPFRLSLVGLTPVESSLLEALFVPSWNRGTGYELVSRAQQAELVVADADNRRLVRSLVRGRQEGKLSAQVLLIGDSDAGTGWPWLPRPIQLHAVMELVTQFNPRADEAIPHDRASADTIELDDPPDFEATREERYRGTSGFAASRSSEPLGRPHPPGDSSLLMWRDPPPPTRPVGSSQFPSPPSQESRDSLFADSVFNDSYFPDRNPMSSMQTGESILLVGSQRLASSSLAKALRQFGYRVDFAADLPQAAIELTARAYHFLFLDAPSLGRKVLPACLSLRRIRSHPPHLVVVADTGCLQQYMAKLVGCDAWMIKPLKRKALKHYLNSRSSPGFGAR